MVGCRALLNRAFRSTTSKVEVLFSHPADPTPYPEYQYEPSPLPSPTGSPVEYQQYYRLSRISAPDTLFEDERILTVRNPDLSHSDESSSFQSSIRSVRKVTSRDSITWESFKIQASEDEEEQLERESILLEEGSQNLPEQNTFVLGFSDEDDEIEEIEEELQSQTECPSLTLGSSLCSDDDECEVESGGGVECASYRQASPGTFRSILDEDCPLIFTATGEEWPLIQQQPVTDEDFGEFNGSQSACGKSTEALPTSEEREDFSLQDITTPQHNEDHVVHLLLDTEQHMASTNASPRLSSIQNPIASLRDPVKISQDQHLIRSWNPTSPQSTSNVNISYEGTYYTHRHNRRQRFLGRDWALWIAKAARVDRLAKQLRQASNATDPTPPLFRAIMSMDGKSLAYRQRMRFVDRDWELWWKKVDKAREFWIELQEAKEDMVAFEQEVEGGFQYS